MLSSFGREAAMFTVAGLFPLKPVMLLMPCHMLLGLLKCSSTLFLYCRLAALMDLLRQGSRVRPNFSRVRKKKI